MALHRIAARNGDCDLFENDAGFDPCEWTPQDICHGSTREQCTCSGILYLVWAACDACSPKPINTTWDDYSNNFDCPSLPQQFPPPFPTGEETFPSWAFSMASATPEPTIFDLAAASAFVLGPSSTPAPPPTTSTPDPPPTTAETSRTSAPVSTTGATLQGTTTSARSVNSSASLPSTVLPSSQGITPSHGPTVPSSPSITMSVSSGSTFPSTSTSSQQDQLSTRRNSFPTGAIAGIVIGICFMIALAVLILCLRRRRRQAAYNASPPPVTPPYADTSDPSNIEAWDSDARIITTRQAACLPTTTSPDAPSSPSNASAWNNFQEPLVPIGRQHLQTESCTMQEKMHLHEEWDSSTSFAPASYSAERNARVLSTFSASNTGAAAPDPDVVFQLRAMTARVRELEAQIESPQVYEWPVTPPPGYLGDGQSSLRLSRQS